MLHVVTVEKRNGPKEKDQESVEDPGSAEALESAEGLGWAEAVADGRARKEKRKEGFFNSYYH